MSYPIISIEKLTEYHLPYLRAAEAGQLTYDHSRYPVHGVPNNAVACYWGGLLADGSRSMRLTEEGRIRLHGWRNSPEGRAWLAAHHSAEAEAVQRVPEPPAAQVPGRPEQSPAHDGGQLALFP